MKRTNSITGSVGGVKRNPAEFTQTSDCGPWSASGLRFLRILAQGIALFVVTSIQFVQISNASEKRLPEIEALIGLKIPAKIQGKRQGDVPGWESIGGAHLGKEGLYASQMYSKDASAIVVIRKYKNKDNEIIDAKHLEAELLTYKLKKGKPILRKSWQKYYSIGSYCEKSGAENIVGMMRPEPGKMNCIHNTKQVIQAWQVNPETGKLKHIDATGVQCSFEQAEDDCNN